MLKVRHDHVQVLWQSEAHAAHHSDPYLIDQNIYGYSGDSFQNKGSFICIDAGTGQEKWSTNEMGWGTSLRVDGYLLTCDIKGNIFLVKPDPSRFIKVAELSSALGDIRGPVWTMPVVANGRLYLRFKQTLVCYDIIN